MEEPVVKLEGLTFTYAGSETPALKDINLTVRPGEFVTITGPSGCGKSTLAFCLTGFIPHSFDGVMEGKVIVGGRDTRTCTPGELAGIAGLVQQDPESQLCTLNVLDEVAFGPENICLPPDEIRERVKWALSAVGLSGFTERLVHTLSGGEKQRLAIASVLAMRPQLLILDEPTANLDPRGCREVLSVIKKLHQEHKTAIIVIEHRLQYLLPFSDRLILIEDGRISGDLQPQRFHHYYPTFKVKDVQEKGREISISSRDVGERSAFSDKPLLAVEDITVKYEQKTALDRVSFSLYPGETVAVMGDNGSGKTTLLHVLLGICKPDQGRVVFNSEDITSTGVSWRARDMGLTFQNPNHQLFERTVIKEARMHSHFLAADLEQSLKRVEQLLEEFDLSSYREQVPFALSLGEKKRLTLISVLAYQPRILLLDEPLVGQDQERLELLLSAIFEHQRRGGITIMVCHEPQVVKTCCTRVLFFEHGNLIFDGPTEEAFKELARRGKDEYLPENCFTTEAFEGAMIGS